MHSNHFVQQDILPLCNLELTTDSHSALLKWSNSEAAPLEQTFGLELRALEVNFTSSYTSDTTQDDFGNAAT